MASRITAEFLYKKVFLPTSGVVDQGDLIPWSYFREAAKEIKVPYVIRATPSLETILAIFHAMENKTIIALIDPTTPVSLEHSLQSTLQKFLKKNRFLSFGIILLTSGTTGVPKKLLLLEKALFYSALGAKEFFKIESDSVLPLSLPLYHVSGLALFFRALLANATLLLHVANLAACFPKIQTKITHLSLVRTQLATLLKENHFENASNLKSVLLGGSSFPNDLLEKLSSYPFVSYTSYGMSEIASLVYAYSLKEKKGFLLPYRKLKTKDLTLLVGGKTLFAGYIEKDGNLLSPFIGGYFKTSDYGHFAPKECYLEVHGRLDDLFLFGGENISKKELEESITKIPEVMFAMVTPLPSAKYGSVPLAIVATHLKHNLTEWKQKFSLVLPKVKMPKVIVTIDPSHCHGMDAKQQLAKLKHQITKTLKNFEALPEEGMVQTWSSSHIHGQFSI